MLASVPSQHLESDFRFLGTQPFELGNRELLRVIAEKAPGSQAKALAELKGLGSKESEV